MTPALIKEVATYSEEDVLRDVAHEIRQPLGAIESIAYYLSLVLPETLSGDDVKHCAQLGRVQQLVEQANWILSNGIALADSRRMARAAVDLEELITQTISSRPATDLPPRLELAGGLPLVYLDPGMGRTLIENLLGLFRQLATEVHPMLVRTAAGSPNGVTLEISTAAPGYRSILGLPPGAALSLDCARRVALAHAGSFTHEIDPASGILARVMLP